MKKSILSLILLFLLIAVPSLKAQVIDELSYVSEKSDVYMYINIESMISFLKSRGVNIKELDELATDSSGTGDDKSLKGFGLNFSDIKEVLFAGRVEDFEKKGGFLFFVKIDEGKGKIPESLKKNSVKIKGVTFYETGSDDGILFSLIGNVFVIGPKEYIEPYLDKRNRKKKLLSETGEAFIKTVSGKTVYINLSVSEYLRGEMEKAYQQGALLAKGLNENVFLKTLLNLRSVDYGIQISDRINFFAGMQGANETDSERLLMLSHFAIVGTSFAASFADMIAARSEDKALGKVTENSEFISSLQQIIGRMKAKQVNNGVVVSFYMTEKETDALIALVKKGIEEEKKQRAERKEGERISAITRAITDKDTAKAGLLLKEKIDINRKDLDGSTVLATAALMGDMKIAELAVEKGAYVDHKTSEGMTALHNAAKGGSTEMVSFLLKKGADINARNENDMTALHFNSQQGNSEVTKILVSAGADVNAIAMDGATAAHLACEGGYIDVIKALAEKNADFTIRDANQERAVDIAARNGHTAIVEFFKVKYNLEPSAIPEDDGSSDNGYGEDYDEETDGFGGDLTE